VSESAKVAATAAYLLFMFVSGERGLRILMNRMRCNR
jgi:hypothetical protein